MSLIVNNWLANTGVAARAMIQVRDWLFVVGSADHPYTSTATRLARVNVLTHAVDVVTFDNADGRHRNGSSLTYSPVTGKVYVQMGLNAFCIVEMDPATLAYRDVVNTDAYANGSRGSIEGAGAYVYAAPENSNRVLRYDPANWSTAPTELATISNQDCIRLDSGGSLFVTGHDPATIARIPFGFYVADHSAYNAPYNSLCDHFAFTVEDDKVWPAVDSNDQDANFFLLPTAKSRLATVNPVRLVPSVVGAQTQGVFEGGGYIWQLLGTSPGRLLRVNPDLAFVDMQLPVGQDAPRSIAFAGTKAYTLSGTSLVAEHDLPDLAPAAVPIPPDTGKPPKPSHPPKPPHPHGKF